MTANYGFSPEAEQYAAEHPFQPNRGSVTGRVALEGPFIRRVMHTKLVFPREPFGRVDFVNVPDERSGLNHRKQNRLTLASVGGDACHDILGQVIEQRTLRRRVRAIFTAFERGEPIKPGGSLVPIRSFPGNHEPLLSRTSVVAVQASAMTAGADAVRQQSASRSIHRLRLATFDNWLCGNERTGRTTAIGQGQRKRRD
jgi:hypothetical protein